MTDTQEIDPVIVESVEHIANRFGSAGLADLIALAQAKLAEAEAALRELSDLE